MRSQGDGNFGQDFPFPLGCVAAVAKDNTDCFDLHGRTPCFIFLQLGIQWRAQPSAEAYLIRVQIVCRERQDRFEGLLRLWQLLHSRQALSSCWPSSKAGYDACLGQLLQGRPRSRRLHAAHCSPSALSTLPEAGTLASRPRRAS